MLEQLFSLIQGESQNEIINNPQIPNEHNNQTVGLATESIFSGLQQALANGGLQDVMGLFSGKGDMSSNPVTGNIISRFIGSLISKLGLSEGTANGIAGAVVPMILGKLVQRTNDPNNGQFDLNGILGSLLGGKTSNGSPVELPSQNRSIDFGSILSRVTQGGGMDMDGDGDVDMQDIMAAVSGAAGSMQQNRQQSGGGIMDLLGGFFK